MPIAPRPALTVFALATLATGCGSDGPSQARPVPRSVTWTAPGAAPQVAPPRSPAPPTARPRVTPSPRTRPAPSPPSPRPAIDWKNRQRPTATGDPDLARQGRALWSAITQNDPARAKGFFFPRKPFTPLKQAGNPDAYWQHIYRLYERDIRRLHRRRRDWTGATFESLTPGTPAAWIKPGQVHNKIGYYRTRFARLRYRLANKRYTLFLHTLITWQGHWYVSHLLPVRRLRPRPRPRP